jgi:hypothetical protein
LGPEKWNWDDRGFSWASQHMFLRFEHPIGLHCHTRQDFLVDVKRK